MLLMIYMCCEVDGWLWVEKECVGHVGMPCGRRSSKNIGVDGHW